MPLYDFEERVLISRLRQLLLFYTNDPSVYDGLSCEGVVKTCSQLTNQDVENVFSIYEAMKKLTQPRI